MSVNGYREVVKNPFKLSCHVYTSECKGGSKWIAAMSASRVVLRSPAFYVLRSLTFWLADVVVDAIQISRGKV